MVKCLLVIVFLALSAFAQDIPKPEGKWLTLSGEEPLVIARGGYSGLFPESSIYANEYALTFGLHTTVLYCNIQLTKDGVGICLTDLRLQNSTNIQEIFPKARQAYKVNGELVRGWFSVDYMSEDLLSRVNLVQSTLSRPSIFDTTLPISTVDDVIGLKPFQLWLNVENEAFYKEHNQSIVGYLQKKMKTMRVNFVSSSEIGILKSLIENVKSTKTKLVFKFLADDLTEPTTGKTYGELAKDLAMIKAFASGIVIRKQNIWPVGPNGYVMPATTLVDDAHKLGIEVYASGFANDAIVGYNYSYDPIREYLQFVDNGKFTVDGLLTDFTVTASQAVACYSSIRGPVPEAKNDSLVISSNGASGDFPGSTDLAYQGAIDDGADVIDCSVQLSKDGVPFCMDMADLMPSTTVITTFSDKTITIPEIQPEPGIFSFQLTWPEILTIKPQTISPFLSSSQLARNPAFKNKGKFMTLPEFLDLAKAKAVSGIMINIQNAAYLASKQGLDLVGNISTALTNASFEKQSTQKVFIRSDDTSVLSIFKDKFPTLTRVLTLDGKFGSIPQAAVKEIKNFAEVVAIPRGSILDITNYFTTNSTPVIAELKMANISVFAYVMRNEYVSLAVDFHSQSSAEISTYTDYFHVDGIITEFPYTAKKFLTNPCRPNNIDPDQNVYPILPISIGSLIDMVVKEARPPLSPRLPPLDAATLVDPPLPPVSDVSSSTATPGDGPAAASPSAAVSNVASWLLSLVSAVVLISISHSAL